MGEGSTGFVCGRCVNMGCTKGVPKGHARNVELLGASTASTMLPAARRRSCLQCMNTLDIQRLMLRHPPILERSKHQAGDFLIVAL